jgi:hypothetical protein
MKHPLSNGVEGDEKFSAQHCIPPAAYLIAMMLALVLTGCASTRQVSDVAYEAPSSNYRLIVMEPDVQVAVLTAGGLLEPREDWTKQAHDHVLNALRGQRLSRGGQIEVAASVEHAGDDAQVLIDLTRLHAAVGQAIKVHKYSGVTLPTKKGKFDWTLGELAVSYGVASSYDYALFVHGRDSFSSGGRVALQAVSFLGCVVAVCVMPQGGMQVAFASLVDLKTGQIVWFNVLTSSVGDIRTEKGAKQMVDKLLATMKLGAPSKKVRQRA